MRNLKSDLPIRPIYLHRDDMIIALCFVSVLALMLYTLIERDCQASPVLVEAGLRTTARVLNVLSGFCLTVFLTPSGYEVFWLDTATEQQVLLWRELQLDDPGTRLPAVRPASLEAGLAENLSSFSVLKAVKQPDATAYVSLTTLWILDLIPVRGLRCSYSGLVRCSQIIPALLC